MGSSRFALGYQLPDELDCTYDLVCEYRGEIGEVYCALAGEPSGRSALGDADGWNPAEARALQFEELAAIAQQGVDITLLLNAACYGAEAASKKLADSALRQVEELGAACGRLTAVTTTSPFIAQQLKQANVPLEIRASVNMRLGTVKAMSYLADSFDGFYLWRELNRSPRRIQPIRDWCDAQGKKLHMLANSGCLRDCAFQSFHDNIVAHEKDMRRQDNVPQKYPAPCWDFLAHRDNWPCILQNTWVRPEDLHHVAPFFDSIKLATRMHNNPRMVVGAYTRGSFRGNLLDLMEPGYGYLLRGYVLDNSRFPEDWFERTAECAHDCHLCGYCREVFEQVLVPMDDPILE